jgi:type IV secretory pathway VirD2 relaxase
MQAVTKAGGDPRRVGIPVARASAPSKTNGRFNARGRGARIVAGFPRDSGWQFDAGTGMRFRARRVVVKARVVKMRGSDNQAASAHLRYLQRDGVTRDGERGRLYSADENEADGSKFLERGGDDRHQFRLIVAPEDGAELEELRGVTRRLMAQMERDLDTTLDWVAVDHFNTAHPHSHIVVRGVTDQGKILNIAGDYIAHGIRHRASEIMTLDLGPQSEWDLRQSLGQEVEQDRFTRLDRNLLHEVTDTGLVDLRPGQEQSPLGGANRALLIDRLKKLERLGLATPQEPGRWTLSAEMKPTLRKLGQRGDIIKTMHRALTAQGIERAADAYIPHGGERLERPIIGRLVGKGLAGDEMTDRLHLVIDGIDGHAHYVEIPGSEAESPKAGGIVEIGHAEAKPRAADHNIAQIAAGNGGLYQPSQHLDLARDSVRVPAGDFEGYVDAHVRRLEALRRAGIVERLDADHWKIPEDFKHRALAYDTQRGKQLAVRVLSVIDLDAQMTSDGATWLDHTLVGTGAASVRDSGFGQELRQALAKRRQWLVEQGLARQDGTGFTARPDMLAALESRELARIGRAMAKQRGDLLPFRQMEDGDTVRGTYKGAVTLVSGKYALVENSREFTLVPWRPVIEKELRREVSGLVRGTGISWQFGRSRGPSIGM